MNVADQMTLLGLLMGEPSDPLLARFTPTQYLIMLNRARRWVCDKTRSVQVYDSQTTDPTINPAIYSLRVDVIRFQAVEWNGFQLDPVPVESWRDRIGDDDTLTGAYPSVYKLWARQIQIFPVPTSANLLAYYGWSYPPNGNLVNQGTDASPLYGSDLDFTDDQAECAIYRAVWVAKDADERDSKDEKEHCLELAESLRKQYRGKGSRYVRSLSNSIGMGLWGGQDV